jgi:flagellar basal body-associated protein FliL
VIAQTRRRRNRIRESQKERYSGNEGESRFSSCVIIIIIIITIILGTWVEIPWFLVSHVVNQEDHASFS